MGVKFSKKVDGTFYVVEAVPDSNAKKLQVISAYMDNQKKSTANAEHALHPYTDAVPQPTPETPYASTLSDSILPSAEKNVKEVPLLQDSITSKMKNSIDELNKMKPVATISGKEFEQNSEGIYNSVEKFFKSIEGKVSRSGFGDVLLTRRE